MKKGKGQGLENRVARTIYTLTRRCAHGLPDPERGSQNQRLPFPFVEASKTEGTSCTRDDIRRAGTNERRNTAECFWKDLTHHGVSSEGQKIARKKHWGNAWLCRSAWSDRLRRSSRSVGEKRATIGQSDGRRREGSTVREACRPACLGSDLGASDGSYEREKRSQVRKTKWSRR